MLRRCFCLALALALLALPAVAIDREAPEPRPDLVERLAMAFLDLWEKAGGEFEPFGLPSSENPESQPVDRAQESELIRQPMRKAVEPTS